MELDKTSHTACVICTQACTYVEPTVLWSLTIIFMSVTVDNKMNNKLPLHVDTVQFKAKTCIEYAYFLIIIMSKWRRQKRSSNLAFTFTIYLWQRAAPETRFKLLYYSNIGHIAEPFIYICPRKIEVPSELLLAYNFSTDALTGVAFS